MYMGFRFVCILCRLPPGSTRPDTLCPFTTLFRSAPRRMGASYEHAHQGTDILAPRGTPLLACERGIITRAGTDVLGGNKIWVKGESGTYYYYAHLEAFAKGMGDGTVLDAGKGSGYAGTSGKAPGERRRAEGRERRS